MVTRSPVVLRGQRNQCPTCGLLFTRNSVFDKHRVGAFGKDRRCATIPEMEGRGMFVGSDGFWRGSRYESPGGPPDAA